MATQEWSTTDAQLLGRALRDFASSTHFPVVFGGYVHEGSVRITAVQGNRTRSLEGLVVQPGRGLGGRALAELRPRMTPDYAGSRHITHDYDGHVLGEGIAGLLAVPVIVDGQSRGMLYGGTWTETGVGDIAAAPGFRIAQELAAELRIREEVERRVAASTAPPPSPHAVDAAQLERLREGFAELRTIAAQVTDTQLRARLSALEHRLTDVSGGAPTVAADMAVSLAPRELDVLSHAGLGATNAEIAAALALKEGTVKSYLQSAMSKLDASTRYAAVARARSLGILP